MNTRYFPAHEREDLVKQLEDSREQVGSKNNNNFTAGKIISLKHPYKT